MSLFLEEFYYPAHLYVDYAIQRQTPTGPELVPYVGTPEIRNYDVSLRLTTPSSPRFTGSMSLIAGRDENFREWAPAYIMHPDDPSDVATHASAPVSRAAS